MEINKLKQIIREEIFNEIKVEKGQIILTPKGEKLAKDWNTFNTLMETFVDDWDEFMDAASPNYDMGLWCYESINNGLLGDGKVLYLSSYQKFLDDPNHSYLELAELKDLQKAEFISYFK